MLVRRIGAVILMFAVISTSIPVAESQEDTSIWVRILIDFGNGEIYWNHLDMADNRTAIMATEQTCNRYELDLDVEWFTFGVFVKGIGGLYGPDDWSWWWSLWIWNAESGDWEASMEGASDVILNNEDHIAWSPSSSKPVATPEMPYPWGQFQRNSFNTGRNAHDPPHPTFNGIDWIFDTGTVEMPSSPLVVDGHIVVNNWGGVFCLSEQGELLWNNKNVVGSFTPAASSENVLVGGKDGFLYCLNITNGEERWKTQITAHPGVSGVTSPPTVVRGKVFVGAFNFSGGPGALLCLEESTGEVLWQNSTPSSVYFSSPAVTEDRVFVGTMGLYDPSTLRWRAPFGMYSYRTDNGDLLWNFSVGDSVGSSPTVYEDMVLFTSKDGYLYCLTGTSGSLLWKKNIGGSVSSPAVVDGAIYVGSGEMGGNGRFLCLDMNGEIKWQFTPNGAVQSSPAVGSDYVYFATNVRNGTVYCLYVATGKLVWQYQPWPEDYIISSPALANDKVYITSDNGRLYCFNGINPYFPYVRSRSTALINVGEEARFIRKGMEHSMYIISLNSSGLSLTIDSIDEGIDISLDGGRTVDTNGDGEDDMGIILNSVNVTSQVANITLYPYSEPEGSGLNLVAVYILTLFAVGLAVMVAIILVAKHISRKAEGPGNGKGHKKDRS